VVGSPIEHSLSPALHLAAYRALGLRQWSYHRNEVPAGGLESFVAGLPDSWVGLSVTMPGKEEALALADEATHRATLAGAANTLIRRTDGWWADNTDVDGILSALTEAGCQHTETAWVLGSGATCRSVLVALHELGLRRVTLQVRSTARRATLVLADSLGIETVVRDYDEGGPGWDCFDVAVSTVPAHASLPMPPRRLWAHGVSAPTPVWAMDVTYQVDSDWAVRLGAAGATRVSGAQMLLHQAARQVQLMTGQEAPLAAMRTALAAGRVHPAT